ncbi:MAG TPA: mechanosensitive ion channel [Leucothrix mucor]|uniref:Mechanosensitive ion channel n=1 Tax=Leucothrix mucor TaxID=45248 RepID=A0A7V2SZB3_LEUMU|nr:mechanosensitive ion channel [Leucothrix mucor]
MTRFFSHYLIFSLTLIIALFFILPMNAFADADNKTVEADAILEPLPLRLTPQWWEQFAQSNHKNLKEHIEQLSKELNSINTPEEARALASQIITLLAQYETKRNTPLAIKKNFKNNEKRIYFLDDVFQLIKQTKSIDSNLQLLNTNHKALLEEIKTADTELNKIKLEYLKQKETDTDKLIKGLKWIKARINLSLLQMTEKAMSSRQKILNETLQSLREEHKFAIDELVVKPKEIKESRLFANLLESTIETVNKDFQKLKSDERSIVVTDEETKSAKQLLSLQALQIAAKLRKLETEHLTHLLIKDINSLHKNSSETMRSAIRKNLHKSLAYIKETTIWMDEAGNRVEKAENALNSQKALNKDKTYNKSIQTRLDTLTKIYEQDIKLDEKQAKLKLLTIIADDKLGKTAKGAAILVEKADETLRDSWKKIVEWMNASLFTMGGTPVTPIGLVRFLFILFIGWFLSRLFLHAIRKVNNRTRGGMQESSIMTLGKIISFVIVGISLLIGFSSLGIDVTKLALVASALSIGIGFGLQNIINNFVSGIILLFERSMKVGDYIVLADGTRGEVREINIRSTVINTNDNIDIIVPNSEFVNFPVTNWTMNERFLRLKVPFGVAYGSDKELVRRIVVDAALSLPYTLNLTERQYPQVRLKNFGDSSLDFDLVVWIKAEWANRPGRVIAAYNWEIETALGKHEVEIPFPQREVRILGKSTQEQAIVAS